MKSIKRLFKKLKYLIIILPFIGLVIFLPAVARAADIGNCSDYAWAEKFGYISFSGAGATPDYGVTVASAGLTGYAWSEKTGWINFDDAGDLYAVTNDGAGNLSGYAWSEKIGYISFDDPSVNDFYQVTIDGSGNFSGYGWSEKLGYINMNDAGALYGVTTTWVPITAPTVTTQEPTDKAITSVTAHGNITNTGGATVTTRGFKYGLTQTDTWDAHEDGSFDTGAFSLPITGLTKGTTYYVRSYAINSQGTGYGAYVQFTTTIQSDEIIFRRDVILDKDVILR